MGKKKGKSKKGKKSGKKEKGGGTELDAAALQAKRNEFEIVALKSQAARQTTFARRTAANAHEVKVTNEALKESLAESSLQVSDVASTMERQYKNMADRCKELEMELANTKKMLELVQLESDRKTEIIKKMGV